ncbi:MAG TPA: PIG-L family deacetylase [bacterium]|nr:PIG-L family deacetylase [bacterium]
MAVSKMKVLVIGAHPDDAEVRCGGLALQYTSRGHRVKFVSATNGDTGHHEIGGIELARRRYREAQAAAEVAGVHEYQILDLHSGELEPTIANRKTIIRIIREYDPDVLITHRPNDYHPDHRYTAQLVQDASYIVTVPNMVALTDIPSRLPNIFYMHDWFGKPVPFQPDVVVAIDEVIEKKIDMLHCHESQFYEWIPFNQGILDQVPVAEQERKQWLAAWRLPYFEKVADAYREQLIRLYGPKGKTVRYAEAFEACEYGAGVTAEQAPELFPFFD